MGERTVYRHFPTERHVHDATMPRLESEAGVPYEDVKLANLAETTARVSLHCNGSRCANQLPRGDGELQAPSEAVGARPLGRAVRRVQHLVDVPIDAAASGSRQAPSSTGLYYGDKPNGTNRRLLGIEQIRPPGAHKRQGGRRHLDASLPRVQVPGESPGGHMAMWRPVIDEHGSPLTAGRRLVRYLPVTAGSGRGFGGVDGRLIAVDGWMVVGIAKSSMTRRRCSCASWRV